MPAGYVRSSHSQRSLVPYPVPGAIFGTGTNGAYVEDVAKITKLKNDPAAALGGKMIVNAEWGAFNNSVRISSLLPIEWH